MKNGTFFGIICTLVCCSIPPLSAHTLWEKFPVDFLGDMSTGQFFSKQQAQVDPRWLLAKKLYDRGMHATYTFEKPRIPLQFHLIWLGSAIPDYYIDLKKQLEELHPQCTVTIWDDQSAARFEMINRRAFDFSKNYAEKSDILRLEILYKLGGVYLDGDHYLFQSMLDLFYACDFFCGCLYDLPFAVNNAVIGSCPNHPIIKNFIDHIAEISFDHDSMKTHNRTGPYIFSRLFIETVAQDNEHINIAFPVGFFSPLPWYDRYKQLEPSFLVKKYQKLHSLLMHQWEARWTDTAIQTHRSKK